jgi:integrase
MRTNKFGIRGLTSARIRDRLRYFWRPPKSLQRAGIFHFKYLGCDFEIAALRARDWNSKLEAYRAANQAIKPKLTSIAPMSVGYLFRQFEASPKFAQYSSRTLQDYPWIYRNVETQIIDACMFGEVPISEVTRQLAYAILEGYARDHGCGAANKMFSACQAAFRYAMLKFPEITFNPFSGLDAFRSSPRRQRWTDQQLQDFINAAEELGYPSIARSAIMCMELVQRPGDILNLRWNGYQENEKVWHIRQSKRGAIVRVPETRRLRQALNPVRRAGRHCASNNFGQSFVCGTVTGKRWQRRNFNAAVRRIARAACLPDDLQIRDLRRTAATEGASAGATPAELMAVGGWVNQASIRPYLVQTQEQAAAFQAKRDAYRRR